jgi:hypothetical protein
VPDRADRGDQRLEQEVRGEKFSDAEYKRAVRDLGDDYVASVPRRVAE